MQQRNNTAASMAVHRHRLHYRVFAQLPGHVLAPGITLRIIMQQQQNPLGFFLFSDTRDLHRHILIVKRLAYKYTQLIYTDRAEPYLHNQIERTKTIII